MTQSDPTDGRENRGDGYTERWGSASDRSGVAEEWEEAPENPPVREDGTRYDVSRTETGDKRVVIHDPSEGYECWIDVDADYARDLEEAV